MSRGAIQTIVTLTLVGILVLSPFLVPAENIRNEHPLHNDVDRIDDGESLNFPSSKENNGKMKETDEVSEEPSPHGYPKDEIDPPKMSEHLRPSEVLKGQETMPSDNGTDKKRREGLSLRETVRDHRPRRKRRTRRLGSTAASKSNSAKKKISKPCAEEINENDQPYSGNSLLDTGSYQIDDDFEGNTVGTDPDGWTVSEDPSTYCDVSDNQNHSGTKSVEISDSNSTGHAGFYQMHGGLTHAVYDFHIYLSDTEEVQFYGRENTSGYPIGVFLDWYSNTLYYHNGSDWNIIDSYDTDEWYHIRVVADASIETYDIYVNGELVKDGAQFYQSCTSLDYPLFLSQTTSEPTFYIDDVLVNDGEGYWIGKTSSEWSLGSNWADGTEPSGSLPYEDVIIPNDCPHYPVVDEDGEDARYLDIEAGAYLDVSSGTSSTLRVYQKMNVTGTLNVTGGDIWVNNGGTQATGIQIYGGGYVDVDGGNVYVTYDGFFYDTGGSYTDLYIETGGEIDISETVNPATVWVQDDIFVQGTVTMSDGYLRTNHQTNSDVTFLSGATEDISGGDIQCSHSFSSYGDFTPTGGTVVMKDNGAPSTGYIDVDPNDRFNVLQISKENAEVQALSDINTEVLYVVDRTETPGVTSYFDPSGYDVNVSSYLSIGYDTWDNSNGQLNITSDETFDVNGPVYWENNGTENMTNGQIYCSGHFRISSLAEFTPSGGNVTMDGSFGAEIENEAGMNGRFYNLDINKSLDVDVDCLSDLTVVEELRLENGDLAVGSSTITVEDHLRVFEDGKLEMKSPSGVLDVDRTGTYCYHWYSGSREEITSGTIRYASGGYHYADSDFTPTGGKVVYDSVGTSYCNIEESVTFNFYDLEISRDIDAWAYTSPESGTVCDVDGDLTINPGYSFGLYDSGSPYAIDAEVAGDWINMGTFVPRGNTVTFDGAKDADIYTGGTGNTKNFYDVGVDCGAHTKNLQNDIDIDSHFSIISGTWDMNGNYFDVEGDIEVSGTLDPGSSNDHTAAGDFTVNSAGTVQSGSGTIRFERSFPPLLINEHDEGTPDYIEVMATRDNVDPNGYEINISEEGGSSVTWDLADWNFSDLNKGEVAGRNDSYGALPNDPCNSGKDWKLELRNKSSGEVIDTVVKGDFFREESGFYIPSQNTGTDGTYYRAVDDDSDNANDWDYHDGTTDSENLLNSGQSGVIDDTGIYSGSVEDVTITNSSATAFGLYNVSINKRNALVSVNGELGVGAELEVLTGTCELTGGDVIDFSEAPTGRAEMDVKSALVLDGTDSTDRAYVISDSDSRVDWTLSGTFNADNYTVTYPDVDGVQFSSPNILSLENGSYDHPASGGALLNLSGITNLPPTIYGCTFDNSTGVSPSYNVRADSPTEKVQFRDYSGSLASTASAAEGYDEDPYDNVYWSSRVRVTAPTDTLETTPGTHTYGFEIENLDSNTDTYNLDVDSSNPDWTVSAPPSVTVSGGSIETVSVDVTIPPDSSDGDLSDIILNASSQNGPQNDEDSMRVTYDHTGSEVIVTGPLNQTETTPGTYTYGFKVENNGSAYDTYDLTISSSNGDWTSSAPSTVTVSAGSNKTVNVSVTIPQDSLDGAFSDISLDASSQNGTQTHGDTARIIYDHTGSEVIVTPPLNRTENAPGTYSYDFHVKNDGVADDTYVLTVETSNSDWAVGAPSTISLTAGSNQTVSVDVTIPQDALDGEYSGITLNASSQNGTKTDEASVRVTYHHIGSDVIVTGPGDANETVPGTHSYDFHVKNDGVADDTYDLTVHTSNNDWTMDAPSHITVPAGANVSVPVDVSVPQDAFDGDLSYVTLNASSQNGTQMDQDTMRVTYLHTGSGVIVTSPGETIVTDPGLHTYSFHVENNGSADDTYDLAVGTSNTDWTVDGPFTIYVPAGTNETVYVDVSIPQDAFDGEFSDISLNATSQNGTQSDEKTFRLTYDHTGSEVLVTAPTNITETDPGTYSYDFDVKNNGTADDSYTFQVGSSNVDWAGTAPDPVNLPVGANKTVTVDVTIPQDALDGAFSDISLNASSQNGTTSGEDAFRLTYDHTGSEVIVTAPTDHTETDPGAHTYSFHVENNGSADDTYDLTALSSDADWSVSAPDSVTVAASTDILVDVDVTIPQDALDGDSSEITLNASSQNGTQTDQDLAVLTYQHTGSDVTVIAPADTTEHSTGNYTYHFDVENNGSADDTYDLTVHSTDLNWTCTAPDEITLTAGSIYTVQVNVTIPLDAGSGNHSDISLNATSQNGTQTSEDTMTLSYEEYVLTVQNPVHGTVYIEGQEITQETANFTYPEGQDVGIDAVADQYYHFSQWTGDNGTITDVDENLTTIEILGNYNISADFTINTHTLTVISTTGGSVASPGEGSFTYNVTETVDLEAVASSHHSFVRWSGDNGTMADTTSDTTTIEMMDDYSITAEFAVKIYSLTIASTAGGNVTGPGEGSFTYDAHQVVELGAEAEPNHHFLGWAGDNETIADPTSNETTLEMLSNYTITARFAISSFLLSVDSSAGGNVEDPGEGTFSYGPEEIVNLTAEAEPGYHFVRWSGDNGTVADPETSDSAIQMDDHYNITAEFTLDTFELTIDSSVGGNVTKPGEGTFHYASGQEINLTAIADEDYHFVRWSGDNATIMDTEGDQTTILMEDDFSITAEFRSLGTVQIEITSPSGGSVLNGSQVTVEWNSENAQYHEVRLDQKEWIDVGMNTSHTFVNLESAETSVEVRALGLQGEESDDSVRFTVDLESPELEILSPEEDQVLDSKDIPLNWQGSDDLSGIESFEVRVDSGEWIDLGTETDYTFEGISDGDHTVEVRAVDEGGNKETQQVSFSVDTGKPTENPSFMDTLCNFWWILLLIVAAVLAAGLLFWRTRREEEELMEDTVVEEPQPPGKEPAAEWEETSLEEDLEGEEDITPEEIEEPLEGEEAGTAVSSGEEEIECPECGENISRDLEECPNCGFILKGKETPTLEDEIFYECDECGSLITEERDDCPYCGASINKE